MKRRDFLRTALASGAVAGGLSVSYGDENGVISNIPSGPIFAGKKASPLTKNWGDSQAEHNTTYVSECENKMLWVRRDNQILATYRNGQHQKYPYIYPLAGPKSMMSVTTESQQPWPHHRSMFFGLDRVNGGNYWQGKRDAGQILSKNELNIEEATETKVTWTDGCIWKKPEQEPIIEDFRRYTIDWRCDDYYVVDFYVKWTPLVDVNVTRTNHGFFGVRVTNDLSPDGGGTLINSDGKVGQGETEGKPAKWCAYYGKRYFNPAITEGVAVFCPPNITPPEPTFENCPWFTRNYGNISPMPFNYNPGPWLFKQGETREMLYRTVVFAGTPADVDLNGLWTEIYG
ncbi:MAG: PmoA family protein [Planctomycetia bacterium]|nr:PmoA family protein [Planctomycetia bacterium]